jgi:hypothetical protein
MSMPPFQYQPPVAFRGSRDYIHSTDIYEEIINGAALANLGFEGPIDLRIRTKITCRPRYIFLPVDALFEDAAATCSFNSGGSSYVAAITETAEVVIDRKAYDDSSAATASIIEGRSARLIGETGLRPVEAVTALAVHLHKTALPPATGQRWMEVQMSIHRPFIDADTSTLALHIDRIVGGTMTRTRIEAIGGPLGTIMFILAS